MDHEIVLLETSLCVENHRFIGVPPDLTLCVYFYLQFQLGACEDRRQCVQCQAWKTGERKDEEECKKCPFKITMVDELKKCKTNIAAL